MSEKSSTFATDFRIKTVGVVQLVRAPDCGSGGRGFEPHLPPERNKKSRLLEFAFFVLRALVISAEFASKWGLFFDGTNIQKMRNRQIL